MKKAVVGLVFAALSSVAFALPTVQQVEAEAKAGRYAQAENMMSEVVAAKPESARAHYVYAELLAHNANFSRASTEAAKAREIDPALSFTDANKFRTFEDTLRRELSPPARSTGTAARPASTGYSEPSAAPATRQGGIPGWVWLVGLVVLAVAAWRMISGRNRMAPGGMAAGMPAGAYPGGPGGAGGATFNGAPYGQGGMPYGQGGVQQGRGGSMLGTGLAAAGGVAGGMLLGEMLHRHQGQDGGVSNLGGLAPGGYDAGSDTAATELENRSVDFGSGGNDWDSGGGSADFGGGGDSGGDSGGGWD